jgi:hypothetical protein
MPEDVFERDAQNRTRQHVSRPDVGDVSVLIDYQYEALLSCQIRDICFPDMHVHFDYLFR